MKSQRRLGLLGLALLLVLPAAAHADTLNMKIFNPNTFVKRVDMKYTIVDAGAGAKIGKFAATGILDHYYDLSNVQHTISGTFLLNAYFNPVTGEIYKDHVNNSFDPLLEVKNTANQILYESHELRRFAYDLAVTYPTFDFEFFNQGGLFADMYPADYIGATLRNASTFSGTKSFISNAAIGTIVFDNKTTMGIEMGTANVFMTPTPTALGGGALLVGCLLVGQKLRSRVREVC